MLELVLLLLAMHQLRMQTAIAIPGGIERVQQDRQIVNFGEAFTYPTYTHHPASQTSVASVSARR